jgi:hypothetical protein
MPRTSRPEPQKFYVPAPKTGRPVKAAKERGQKELGTAASGHSRVEIWQNTIENAFGYAIIPQQRNAIFLWERSFSVQTNHDGEGSGERLSVRKRGLPRWLSFGNCNDYAPERYS